MINGQFTPDEILDLDQTEQQLDNAIAYAKAGGRPTLGMMPTLSRLILRRAKRDGWDARRIHEEQLRSLDLCELVAMLQRSDESSSGG